MTVSYFTTDADDSDVLHPTEIAVSLWNETQLQGVALGGALARAAERRQLAEGRTDLRPARVTVDLFRATAAGPCRFRTEVVRSSGRLLLIDTHLVQDGPDGEHVTARSSTLFVRPTEEPPGEVWRPAERLEAPTPQEVPVAKDPYAPYLRSDAEWTQEFARHQNGARKAEWALVPDIVAGERVTPFQAAGAQADGANLVGHWGSEGISYINADVTLVLARLPRTAEVGLIAVDRVAADGISVATVAVMDRDGQCGHSTVTGISNVKRSIDLGSIQYDDQGRVT